MTVFHSSVNPASDEFKRNRADMLASIEAMREILDRAAILSDLGGSRRDCGKDGESREVSSWRLKRRAPEVTS